jgi:hypothetical protein
MTVQGTRWVLPLAFTMLASLVGERNVLAAADDVIPPTLTCVDGVLARITPRPGVRVRFRRRWFCDVDRQVNGVCTFGRRCRQGLCPAICLHCGVTIPVPVGEERREGPVVLACLGNTTRTPCGPTLSCDTATEVCVARERGGPSVFYSCDPVPAGCESDRTCRCVGAALCQAPSTTCTDDGPNAITCACPACV